MAPLPQHRRGRLRLAVWVQLQAGVQCRKVEAAPLLCPARRRCSGSSGRLISLCRCEHGLLLPCCCYSARSLQAGLVAGSVRAGAVTAQAGQQASDSTANPGHQLTVSKQQANLPLRAHPSGPGRFMNRCTWQPSRCRRASAGTTSLSCSIQMTQTLPGSLQDEGARGETDAQLISPIRRQHGTAAVWEGLAINSVTRALAHLLGHATPCLLAPPSLMRTYNQVLCRPHLAASCRPRQSCSDWHTSASTPSSSSRWRRASAAGPRRPS